MPKAIVRATADIAAKMAGRAHRAVLALTNQVREPQHAIPVRQIPTRPREASLPVTRALRDPTEARAHRASRASTRRWQDRHRA